MNINLSDQKSLSPFNVLGLLGVLVWVLTIFLRETPVVQNPDLNFWLGIAPNFGVALLLPMLLVNYYPVVFKRALTLRFFLFGLAFLFVALTLSEIVHDVFLSSKFDIYDVVASLVGLMITGLASVKIFLKQENDHA